MTSADFIREHSWVVAAFVLFIVVLFGLLRRLAQHRTRRSDASSHDRRSPDELPDLNDNIQKIKIITIFAGGCIIGFTLWAVFNSLSQ